MDKLWGDFCENQDENWPRYNGTALYSYFMQISHVSCIWPSGCPCLFILNTKHNRRFIFCPGSFGYCKHRFIPTPGGGTRSGAAPGSETLPYFRESRTPKTYLILGKSHNPGHPKWSGLQNMPYFRENFIIPGTRSGPDSENIPHFREIW